MSVPSKIFFLECSIFGFARLHDVNYIFVSNGKSLNSGAQVHVHLHLVKLFVSVGESTE